MKLLVFLRCAQRMTNYELVCVFLSIQRGEVYDYSGGRTIQELTQFATGGYKASSHAPVPPPSG